MGHSINHYTSKVTNKKGLDAFLSNITEDAYNPKEAGCYHGNLTVHQDKVYKDYDEAMQAIQHYDSGWYDDHVVMYYDISNEGRNKIEEWNKKREASATVCVPCTGEFLPSTHLLNYPVVLE